MRLPKISRGTAIIVGLVGGILLLPTASDAKTGSTEATTTKTYVRTLAGTDFRSLDVAVFPQFLSGSGGGVYPLDTGTQPGGASGQFFFETTLDLPSGARVTEVTLYVRNCLGGTTQGYFGAYTPTLGGYAQYATLDVPTRTPCATQTVTRTGAPITTVGTATKRYVIGTTYRYTYAPRQTAPDWALIGGRIKWTCTSTCA